MAAPRSGETVGRADLHTHTTASDGSLAPADLIAAARSRGLAAIAITDHDTVEGVEDALTIASPGLRIMVGVELSCVLGKVDIHMLGYGFDTAASGLRSLLGNRAMERRERAATIVERLVAFGAPVELNRVIELAGPGTIGRPHIARALVEAGHASSVGDAFDRFLGTGQPGYVERPELSPERAITEIHAAGGAAVLAHPLYSPGYAGFLPGLVEAGLDGIEVVYPDHNPETRRSLSQLAAQFGLVETGGTDFHGDFGRPGKGLGDTTVSVDVIDQLAARSARRRAARTRP